MKILNWQNFTKMLCPYCDEGLIFVAEIHHIKCSNCRFHIDEGRFKEILYHRSNPDAGIKLKWQNLQRDRCPADEGALVWDESRYFKVLRCVHTNCDFRIREDVYAKYMNDPRHPVNRFNRKEYNNERSDNL